MSHRNRLMGRLHAWLEVGWISDDGLSFGYEHRNPKRTALFCVITFEAQWLLYAPSVLTFVNSTFCPHSVFICFVWISEQTAIIFLYRIKWLVFITKAECVYCAVRTGSWYIIQPSGYYMYHQFDIHKLHVPPTQCIYVFCMDLRNSDYCPMHH